MPPWWDIMRAFDIDGILTNLHEFLKTMWKTGALNHKVIKVTQRLRREQWRKPVDVKDLHTLAALW